MTKIMIVSSWHDPHVHAVMDALIVRGDATVELLDLSEFPMQLSLTMMFEKGDQRFFLRRQGGGEFDLSQIGAVWWRRPQPYGLPLTIRDPAHRRYALSETETAFQGLYQSMNAFWINAPRQDTAAVAKPWQLAIAQEIGLEIPPTLMTSDPDAAQEFWRQHEGDVIYKQFIAMHNAWRETRRLKPKEVGLAQAVRFAPVIFQQYVEAVADIRVIAIGQELFAASTDVRNADYPVDVRMNLDAHYEAHELPSKVENLLRALMARMGLEYGAIDLRLTPEGQYIFLEINPAGQFLYIEQDTNQRIAAALAAHLVNNAL